MTCGLLAIGLSAQALTPSVGLEALSYDHIQLITVAKPRTTFENLDDLNGRKWVTLGQGQEMGTGCIMLTNDGYDLITSGNVLRNLRQGLPTLQGDIYFMVTNQSPLTWVAATESQQKHMKVFQSTASSADGIRRYDHLLGVFDYKHHVRWIAGTVYPLMKRNPNPKRETDRRYVDAGGTDRLLMALVRADERGEHPNVEVTVPLGAKLKVLRMGARFDNLGRAVVELFVKTGAKACGHRWYLVDFGTKRGSEDKSRRKSLPLVSYQMPNSKDRTELAPYASWTEGGKHLYWYSLEQLTREFDEKSQSWTDLPKVEETNRYKYWRGHLLLEPVKQEKVDDSMGGLRSQYRSQGLYLFSEDRKSKTFLGPYTWMCGSRNEKHLLLRRLTDETVWKLSWDKAPGG